MKSYKTNISIGLLIVVILASGILYVTRKINPSPVVDNPSPSTQANPGNNVPSTSAVVPVRIFIGGDIMLDRNVRKMIDAKGFDFVFGDVKAMLSGMDISVANLEGPFTMNPSVTVKPNATTLQFTFDPTLAPKLRDVGFTMFGLANNHTENFGTKGLTNTRNYLTQAGLAYYGDPENATEISTTTTSHGLTIAFVGFHEFTYKNLQNIYDEIDRLRPTVDYIIVSPHWGIEYQSTSSAYQQKLAHAFIDHGADAVIGAHPHVIEQMEIYNGKPIFYSLGNFVFDQNFSFETTHGLTLELDLTKIASQSQATSSLKAQFKLIPITIDNNHPEPASPTIRNDILQTLAAISDVSPDMKNEIRQGSMAVEN